MKTLRYLIMIAVLVFPSMVFAEDLGQMRLSLTQGAVQVASPDTPGEWEPADQNMPIYEGDRLWAPEGSRAEVQIRGGVFVRAGAGSSLDVIRADADSAQFYMNDGHIYINNRLGGIKIVQVDTPSSSVRSYDNSVMMVDLAGGTTEVQVLKGYAYAESREGQTRVPAGSAIVIRPDGAAEIYPIARPDEWERWNVERDSRLSPWRESSRYLPDELKEYSPDFDANGRWFYDAEFGYVWAPRVTYPNWAPYRLGRWQWVRGRYVWLPREPWGWAPYHYGRWSFRASIGWFWVPPPFNAVYWGPGYVGWVITNDYVGWVPLAPGEIYYGYGNYGPFSADVSHIDMNTVIVGRYRNSGFRFGMMYVHRDTFGTHERREFRPREDPFKHGRFRFAPPDERPGEKFRRRENPVPEHKRPPERVRQVRPDEIRERRQIIREREGSVFTREHPKELKPKEFKEPRRFEGRPEGKKGGGVEMRREKKQRKEDKKERKEEQKGRKGGD